jgi:hypothetical protein
MPSLTHPWMSKFDLGMGQDRHWLVQDHQQ